MFFIGLQLAGSEKQVLCEVAIVECRNNGSFLWGRADKQYRRAGFDQKLEQRSGTCLAVCKLDCDILHS